MHWFFQALGQLRLFFMTLAFVYMSPSAASQLFESRGSDLGVRLFDPLSLAGFAVFTFW